MALDCVPPQLIAMIKAYYRSTTARVLISNSLSQQFGQSCILSPIMFNYAIDQILGKALHEGDGVEFAPGHRLTDLDYADTIALLASSVGALQSMFSRASLTSANFAAPLEIDGGQLEEVDSFKHLGARLLPNGQLKDNIVSRVDNAG
nr:unnamed protein product [Spirometra erinaceieuropaei]